jgi:type-F conjugative transfer system mating-pair stabilization protein TraN
MKRPGQRWILLKERYFLNRFSALVLTLLFQALSPLNASEVKNYGAGKDFVAQHQVPHPKDARDIPGFKGANIPEAGLSSGNIQKELTQKMKEQGSVGQFIHESHDQRLRFKIDPLKDPIFTESDKIADDPLSTLKVKATDIDDPVQEVKTQHVCDEEGEPYLLTCTRHLVVETVKKTKTYAYTHVSGKQFRRSGRNYGQIVSQTRGPRNVGHDQWYDYKQYTYLADQNINYFDGCNYYPHRVKNYYTYTKRFGTEAPVGISEQEYNSAALGNGDIRENWTSDCSVFEDKLNLGLCSYVDKKCTQGKATRVINGFAITRPCWQETLTYQCAYPVKNTCGELKAKGCVQIQSQCKKMIDKTCVHYAQTYECTERHGGGKKIKIQGEAPWCLNGNCVEQGFAANKDMAEALSKLMLFREIQKDMDLKTPSIFKGTEYGCNRNCVDFKDCCSTGKGWGVSMGLAGCSEKEKALGQLRQDKKCVFVGTYCAEKVLGVCLRRKSNFCCFGTKLARLIHEQGRPQLKMTFGDAEHPQCRGFTVEELTKLNFEKIDLSELLSELTGKFKAPNMTKLSQDFKQDWSQRMPLMNKEPKPPLQKLKETQKDAVF